MIEVKGTIVGNQGTIQSSEVNTKETVVGKLGNTKQSLNGSPNVGSVFVADYKLPIATEETLGGIIVGENLTVEEDGKLSAIVPSKVSELENDSGYITKIPNDYVTEEELANKGYLTKVPSAYKTKEENDALYQPIGDYALNKDIPTKVGDLENDIGYITEVPSEYITETELATSLSTKADKTDIPTKTSQLTNDSGFLTKIPSEYITESELDSKGYLTEHQDISHLATKSELHTHSNKTVLDSITQDKVDKWNAGSRNVVLSPSEPTMGEEIWFQKSVNLFNKATVNTSNALLLNSTGGEQYSSDYRLSEYIEIKPNTQYTISGVHLFFQQDSDIASYCFYDGNKTFISAIGVKEGTDTFTTPSGAYFIRCSIYYYSKKSNNLDTFQLEIGSTASAYQPYVSEKIYTKTNGGYEEFEVGSSGGSTGGVVEESDPTVPDYVKAITQADIAKWNSGTGTGGNNNIIVDGDGAIISTEESNGVYMWVHNSETFTLQKDTITKIPFDTLVSDTSNGKLIHENGGIRIGKGVKQILVLTKWNNWTYTCQKYIYVYKNGVLHEASGFPTGAWTANVVSYVDVQEGDFIETYGYHNYSSSLGIASNSAQSGLKVIVLSETTNIEVDGETNEIITLKSAETLNISTNAAYEHFKMETISQIGNSFSIENGNLKIGSGISKVLISFTASLSWVATSGNKYVRVERDGQALAMSKKYVAKNSTIADFISMTPVMIDVQEGDILKLGAYGTKDDNYVKGQVYFTVQKVDETNVISGGGSSNVYSAEEQVIGTWFDKPLYRRVFDFGNLTVEGVNDFGLSEHGIEWDKVTNFDVMAISESSKVVHKVSPAWTATSSSSTLIRSMIFYNTWENKTVLRVWTNGDQSGYKINLTVEYTKVTD
jgi:hypothetical protein